MQSLLVQALTLRQLGRLKPRQLLPPGYGPGGAAEWSPRTIHTRQLWGCSSALLLAPGGSHHSRPVVCGGGGGRDVAGSWCLSQRRFKSKKKGGGAAKATREEEEDEEDEERDPEDTDDEVHDDDDDPNPPKGYTDVEKSLPSFRYDGVMKSGLDLARNKIEDAFYGNKLWLNGQRLVKKSKTVKVGDTLDLVLSEDRDADTVLLRRVVVRRLLGPSADPERQKVLLRRWKHLQLPKADAFK